MGSDESGKSGGNLQNLIIMVLLAVIVVLLAVNLYKGLAPAGGSMAFDRATARKNDKEASGRREEEPYIANQVKNTITKRYMEIRECWNAYVEKKPELLEGKVMIDWQITPAGEVKSPEVVSSEFTDSQFTACLIEKVKTFKFPPPPSKEDEYVAHKFMFKFDAAKKD